MTMHIGIPTMILLCLTWVYYHFRFFLGIVKKDVPVEKKTAAQQSAGSVAKEAEDKLKEQFQDDSDYEDNKKEDKKKGSLKLRIYNSVQSLIKKLSDVVIVISSLS